MGHLGTLVLVNGTPHDWLLTTPLKHNLREWDFPGIIKAFTIVNVPIRFCSSKHYHTLNKTIAQAYYTLAGTNKTFTIKAKAKPHYQLQAVLTNIDTIGTPKGNTIDLGWKDNGTTKFILTGQNEIYHTINNISGAWMQSSLATLGNKTLKEICIPGAHDAGMNCCLANTIGACENNTVTQILPISGQLAAGIRYFDIRPCIGSGNYHAGHYTDTGVKLIGWQGARGESIADIITAINDYTTSHKELIILQLSHAYHTDDRPYTDFTPAQWDELLKQLLTIKHRFIFNSQQDLTSITLKQFILDTNKQPRAAVVILIDPADYTIPLKYTENGFYPTTMLPIFNQYANSDKLLTMESNQISKLKNPLNHEKTNFLLSWTLTQSPFEAIIALPVNLIYKLMHLQQPSAQREEAAERIILLQKLETEFSILGLADKANQELLTILPNCTQQLYPNIILLDGINDSLATTIAMIVNNCILQAHNLILETSTALQSNPPVLPVFNMLQQKAELLIESVTKDTEIVKQQINSSVKKIVDL